MTNKFLHISITVNIQDYEATVLDILSEAKPTWDRKNINIEKIEKGFLNTLLVCHEKQGSETRSNNTECDKIIVRVFGDNLGEMDRQPEIEIMKIVSEKGIIPNVYGSLIALKLHAIHSLGGEKLKQNMKKNNYVELNINKYWIDLNLDDLKPVVQDSRFKDHFGSLEQLGKLKADANAIYDELVVRYPLVFCHMDAHNQNIVYDSKTDKITYIDWEIYNMAPEVLDIAMLVDRDYDFNDTDPLDNAEARGKWVRTYLSTHPQYMSEPITDELFQQWYSDSLRASMVSTLTIGMWGIFSVVHSAKDFDFFIVVKDQMDRFYRYRTELAEIENK